MTKLERVQLKGYYKDGLYYWKQDSKEAPEELQTAINEINKICCERICAPMEFVIEHFPEHLFVFTKNPWRDYGYVQIIIKDPKKLNKAIRAYAKA